MLRASAVLLLLSLLVLPAASEETIYSGKANSATGFVDVQDDVIDGFYPGFSSENISLNITKVDGGLDGLEVYSAYQLNVPEGKGINIELILEKDKFENWTRENGFEYYHYNIITSENSVMNLNKTEGEFRSQVIIPKNSAVIYIAGSQDIYENYQRAVNPEGSFCGLYWNPPENYTVVDNCNGQLDQGLKLPELDNLRLPAIIGLFVIILLAVFREKRGSGDRDIEEITEDIIRKMESGQLPKDRELLDKLEKANEKAYNDEYEEASELLDEVKKELDQDI